MLKRIPFTLKAGTFGGNHEVHYEVLSDPDVCRMKVNVKIPEFNILAEENEFFGEVKFKFEECKNVN